MSGSGSAHNSYLYGAATGNPVSVNSSGNVAVQANFTKPFIIGRKVLRTGKVFQLPDIPAAWVQIFSEETNGNYIWIGGYGAHAPQIGLGTPLLVGHPITLPCTNTNMYSLLAQNDGDAVNIICGLVGDDIANFTPYNDPTLDLTKPTVVSSTPANSSTGQQTNVSISIQMSEAIDISSITTSTVTISPAISYTPTLDSGNNSIIRVIPASNLAFSTTYTVTLGTGVTDLSGNPLASTFSFSFTTASAPPPPDTTPPVIVSSFPASGAIVSASNTVPSITFSKAMKLSSFANSNTYLIFDSNSQLVSGITYTLSADSKTVYLNTTLQGSQIYDIKCSAANGGPTDTSGNLLSGNLSSQFTTSSTGTSTKYNVSGDSWDAIYHGSNTAIKETVGNISSLLYLITPTSYTIKLKKVGNPSGGVNLKIINNSNSFFTTMRTIYTGIPMGDIASDESWITVNDPSNTYQLNVNDQVSIEYTGGDSNNYILVKVSSSDAFDGSNTFKSKTNSNGNNSNYTSSDVAMQIDGF